MKTRMSVSRCCCVPCPDCEHCSGGAPCELSVTFTDIDDTGNNGSCNAGADCAGYNGTYVLERNPTFVPSTTCNWFIFFGFGDACEIQTINANLFLNSGTLTLSVIMQFNNGEFLQWRTTFGAEPDCNAWEDLDLPPFNDLSGACSNINSTCAVSAA